MHEQWHHLGTLTKGGQEINRTRETCVRFLLLEGGLDKSRVAALTEQDLREHALMARVDYLEDQVRKIINALRDDEPVVDPIADMLGSVH